MHRVARLAGRSAVVALVALVASACQLRVNLVVDVEGDGSGVVRVAVGVDEQTAKQVPNLAGQLRVSDLRQAGWTVTGPALERDGFTWVRASKPFARAEEAGAVLAEVSGPDGPFQGFALRRDRSVLRDRFSFDGTVDLTARLDALADDDLRKALGEDSVADVLGELDDRIDRLRDEAVQVQVAVLLPGPMASNAPTRTSDGVVWRPALGERAELTAHSSEVRTANLGFVILAVLSGIAFVVLVGWRIRRWRAAPGTPSAVGDDVGGAGAQESRDTPAIASGHGSPEVDLPV